MNLTYIRHRTEYFGLLIVAVLFYYLPRKAALFAGEQLGNFIAHVIPVRRSVVESNLSRAFPGKSRKEIKKLAVSTYKHFGEFVAEFAREDKYSVTDLRSLVTIKNKSLLEKIEEQQDGAIVLVGHFGNWEILGRWLGMMNYPMTGIQQPQENPLVDRFIQKKRIANGTKVISKYSSISDFLQVVQDGRILFIAADQDAKSSGVFVNFFGVPSSTARGAAVFAHKLKTPVILAFPIKNEDKTYTVILEELETHGMGTSQAVHSILQQYMNRLEFYVRQYPEQYFWFHRRWKTQPEKEEATDVATASLAGATG